MSETNVETNCLDIIEQLRFDRDKYIGMWRAQCRITEQTMKERDAALGGARDEMRQRQADELRRICEEG